MFRLFGLSVVIAFVLLPFPGYGQQAGLKRFNSRYYAIYTNLSKSETRDYGTHMDAVFAEYRRRFASFYRQQRMANSLYLLRTREDYIRFMASIGINAANSGGMFFIRPEIQGLATWTEGFTKSEVHQVLQHEGFHQFAWRYLGANFPTTFNEGIAQYFEDGIMIRGKFKLGMVNAARSARIKSALQSGSAIPFDDLLNLSNQGWSLILQRSPELAGLAYAQAWSICHFLVHGDNGKYRGAFEKMLKGISAGHSVRESFALAFRTSSTSGFRKRWEKYVQTVKPDPVTLAVERLQFLGRGVTLLVKRETKFEPNIDGLETALRNLGYRMIRTTSGVRTEFDSADHANFVYQRNDGSTEPFKMFPSPDKSLPPMITATGLVPQPSLSWRRDDDGQIIGTIEYK